MQLKLTPLKSEHINLLPLNFVFLKMEPRKLVFIKIILEKLILEHIDFEYTPLMKLRVIILFRDGYRGNNFSFGLSLGLPIIRFFLS